MDQQHLIRNIVTNIVAKRYTPHQIALAVLIQQKSFIGHLYGYHVTCFYDKLLRFRTSVDVWSANRQTDDVIRHRSDALVQINADSFDCNIN